MTRERRNTYVAGAGLVALALAGGYGLGRMSAGAPRTPAGDPTETAPQEDMAGMSGMPGMSVVDEGATVSLTASDIGTFGITFGTAERRRLVRRIRAVASVEFDETRMAYVSPKFGGWVERLHVDFTGARVRAGAPLLDVYSPELVSAQEELLLAARMAESMESSPVEGAAAGAQELLASGRRRLDYWDISDEQVEELLATGDVRKSMTIHAPVSGIVMEKGVFEGQAFTPGTNLYMIADLARVWVNAEIFEADAALTREGMPVELTVAALPGRTFGGRLEYVYPTFQERTRSLRARVAVPNPRLELKPGMYATVKLDADLGDVLSVPHSAVLHSGERAVAFVDMGGGQLMPHELLLGARGEEYVEVIEGLEHGQRVVTSAQFLLDSESNLAEVMRAMMAQMNLSDIGSMDMGGMDMGGMEVPDSGGMSGMEMPDSGGGR